MIYTFNVEHTTYFMQPVRESFMLWNNNNNKNAFPQTLYYGYSEEEAPNDNKD